MSDTSSQAEPYTVGIVASPPPGTYATPQVIQFTSSPHGYPVVCSVSGDPSGTTTSESYRLCFSSTYHIPAICGSEDGTIYRNDDDLYIYRSNDDGDTWHRVPELAPGAWEFLRCESPTGTFLSGCMALLNTNTPSGESYNIYTLWITKDSGTTWTSTVISSATMFINNIILTKDFKLMFAMGGHLFISSDYGATPVKNSGFSDDEYVEFVALGTPYDGGPSTTYVGYYLQGPGTTSALYRMSADYGLTWTIYQPPTVDETTSHYSTLMLDGILYRVPAGGAEPLQRSCDNGTTYTTIPIISDRPMWQFNEPSVVCNGSLWLDGYTDTSGDTLGLFKYTPAKFVPSDLTMRGYTSTGIGQNLIKAAPVVNGSMGAIQTFSYTVGDSFIDVSSKRSFSSSTPVRTIYAYDIGNADLRSVVDYYAIKQSIKNIISTPKGTAIRDLTFGTSIYDVIYDIYGSNDTKSIISQLKSDIESCDSRITISSTLSTASFNQSSRTLSITLVWSAPLINEQKLVIAIPV